MDAKKVPLEPLMVDTATAARALGLSRSAFYEGLSSGRIGPAGVFFNSKRLFPLGELRAWVNAGCPPRRLWLAEQITQDVKQHAGAR
jgi:hypothetical protein